MPDQRIVLSARGDAVELSLVEQDQRLFILRDGQRLDDRSWALRDLNDAVEQYHVRLKVEGIC